MRSIFSPVSRLLFVTLTHSPEASINNLIVRLTLFQHHSAGGDARPEKQIGRELDHAVDKVVVHKVFAYFLLRAAPVHDAREADDSRRTVGRQPGQRVHNKGQVGLGLGSQHPGGSEAGIVDKSGVTVPSRVDNSFLNF